MRDRTENHTFARLQSDVIGPGLCTHCGTCVGLSHGTLHMSRTQYGPLPTAAVPESQIKLDSLAYVACPGKGVDYPQANQETFARQPGNWLIGCVRRLFVGYSADPDVRRQGASGGLITHTLMHLLETGRIDGAVVVDMGRPKPWLAESFIARSAEEIRAASQSVYAPVPVNVVLDEMANFDGRLAYVGLPDQVASLRQLQKHDHAGARKVDYVLGPYVGTNMYLAAIESYLRANGIHSLKEVAELNYRAGEWPGYLQIRTNSGQLLRVEKFYYNYLIPFYITRSSLLSVDFTNELTDISVGDAWHPRYEAQGAGFSVVVARSPKAESLLQEMQQAGAIVLDEISVDEALAMHGHMIDFKKRGTFIRLGWRQAVGKPVPEYGYRPATIPLSRKLVELVISLLFLVCGTRPARKVVEGIPITVIGPLFNTLRKAWKQFSKPTKRKGLKGVKFESKGSVHI